MSRGDAIYFKGDVDMLDGERIGRLEPLGVYTYLLGYWATGVKYRCDTFHPTSHLHFTCKRLASRLHLDGRSVRRHMHQMLDLGLLIQNPDGSITVEGVKNCHQKMHWKEYEPPSPYGETTFPHTGPKQTESMRVREYDSSTVPLGTTDILTTLQGSPNSESRNPEEGVVNDPMGEKEKLTPESERWRKTDAILASLWPQGMSDEFRDSVKWKIHDAVDTYPEVWINEAMMTTRDKQLRIAEGVAPNFTSGPGSYFLGILKKKEVGK